MHKTNKIEYVDFAKGYAILSIVLYHLCQRIELHPMLQKAIIFGGTGVHLFFLLSGFGLGMSKSVMSATDFYRRRMSKVWLPYILVLSISLLAAVTLGLFRDRWDAWLAGVGLYQMFFGKYIASFGGHFWFISAIMQFYLVFPGLQWVQKKIGHSWAFFGVALLVSMLWWEVVFLMGKGDERIWNSCFLQFLWEFALGMVLAEIYKKTGDSSTKPSIKGDFWNYSWWAYLPIGLFFTGIMILMILKMGDIGKIFNDVPALIGYTALSVFLYHLGDRFIPPIKKFFLWISSFSFSLYLVHVLVLELYLIVLLAYQIPVSLAVMLPFVVLALLSGWTFEPLSRWWSEGIGNKFFAPKTQ